jgi:protein-tyrosine phosphatase
LAARPRGGDWLEEEISGWKQDGVDTVFSLLTPEEEADLDIADEAAQTQSHGMKFLSFPIPDRQVPASARDFGAALRQLDGELSAGRNVVLHCRQGIGRTGLVAACLLVTKGVEPGAAVEQLSTARSVPIPETLEQRQWIDRFAGTLAGAR